MAAKAFLSLAAARRMSAAIIFLDFRAAFYSVLTETVLGAILSELGRATALASLGMLPAEIADFQGTFTTNRPFLEQHGLGAAWCRALASWHSRAWFRVPGGVNVVVTDGTKLLITGADRHMVGQVASSIKLYKPVEPYKGKGVRVEGEFVRRKEGKKTA